MRRLDGCSRLFLVAFAVYVAGRYLGRPLIPYSGSVAVTALGALIWSRPLPRGAAPWTRYLLLTGLALLAGVLARPDDSGPPARLLTAGACATIGLGVLARADRLRRWSNLPSVLFAVLVVGATVGIVRGPAGRVPAEVMTRAGAAILPAVVLIVLGFAVNAALTSGGGLWWAGAGLMPVLALAFPILTQDNSGPRPLPATYFADPSFAEEAAGRAALAGPDLARIRLPDPSSVSYRLPVPATPARPASPLRRAVDQIRPAQVDPAAAVEAAFLFVGLAALTTALFPYRE